MGAVRAGFWIDGNERIVILDPSAEHPRTWQSIVVPPEDERYQLLGPYTRWRWLLFKQWNGMLESAGPLPDWERNLAERLQTLDDSERARVQEARRNGLTDAALFWALF
ncbi:hypothetical protein CLAFUW4_03755 [Fulvia fulva]|uniref:uncharacterized protein n=1 Tax=Passalora fulva TaxID=5499 RepID=UPI0028525995|nr:uncharacterized protein CLAFUR5_20165 [Fulvia fulva]KAK4631896.1 hypothetical protein CLAFUR4_03743 [Fulvia fulva]KAK4633102.1 hypothetical protein CLAFUR0_03743 [Fulvia fulva]WMI38805.1 hypothetical protein CLAFUR5_20165 [Fulvia fulva]WPV11788.1 hypothetical protein CLAFUW4_03755 [Fulvia fulva]WPV26577.1 hypothetical protein CLAFUW7_03747 [Fulvia fulva]